MRTFYWVSRHDLTVGQIATVESMCGENIKIVKKEIIFGDNPLAQVKAEGIACVALCGIVAPMVVALALLRDGYVLTEFASYPSSRAKGLLVCKGAYSHALHDSIFHECPMSEEEQEAVSIC